MADGRALRVLQVTRSTSGGGAERIAVALHQGIAARGHSSWLVTRDQMGPSLPNVLQLPSPPHLGVGPWAQRRLAGLIGLADPIVGVAGKAARRLDMLGTPTAFVDDLLGRENFDYPGTRQLADLAPEPIDLIHLHNLHGSYFDLRQLAPISARTPTLVTLHDEWMFTGHCGYALECERWRSGCGSCPHLDTYPAVRRDSTARNLEVKSEIYGRSRLHVSAPSQWLLSRAQESVLARAAATWRVVPNGIDQDIFKPGNRAEARGALALPINAFIILYVAHRARTNEYKDYPLVEAAVAQAASERPDCGIRLIVVGDEGPTQSFPGGSSSSSSTDGDLTSWPTTTARQRLRSWRQKRQLPNNGT